MSDLTVTLHGDERLSIVRNTNLTVLDSTVRERLVLVIEEGIQNWDGKTVDSEQLAPDTAGIDEMR